MSLVKALNFVLFSLCVKTIWVSGYPQLPEESYVQHQAVGAPTLYGNLGYLEPRPVSRLRRQVLNDYFAGTFKTMSKNGRPAQFATSSHQYGNRGGEQTVVVVPDQSRNGYPGNGQQTTVVVVPDDNNGYGGGRSGYYMDHGNGQQTTIVVMPEETGYGGVRSGYYMG